MDAYPGNGADVMPYASGVAAGMAGAAAGVVTGSKPYVCKSVNENRY
jgi:hypothetical protein